MKPSAQFSKQRPDEAQDRVLGPSTHKRPPEADAEFAAHSASTSFTPPNTAVG